MVVLGRYMIKNRQAYMPEFPIIVLPNNLLSTFIVFSSNAEFSYLSCKDNII